MPGVLVFYSCSMGHNPTRPPSTKVVGAADYRGKKWNLVVRRLGLLPLGGGCCVSPQGSLRRQGDNSLLQKSRGGRDVQP